MYAKLFNRHSVTLSSTPDLKHNTVLCSKVKKKNAIKIEYCSNLKDKAIRKYIGLMTNTYF